MQIAWDPGRYQTALAGERVASKVAWLTLSSVLATAGAMMLYAEPFRFWEHALSDLGRTASATGAPNWASLGVFVFGMVRAAAIMLSLGISVARSGHAEHRGLKAGLSFSAAAGFLGTCIPHDLCHAGHVVGSALMVFSLWALGVLLLVEVARQVGLLCAVLGQLLLQGTVLTYAVAYVADLAFKQAAQKPAVAGLFLTLCFASFALRGRTTPAARRAPRAAAREVLSSL